MVEDWKQEMTNVAILYLIAECGKKIPTNVSLVLDELKREELADASFLSTTMNDLFVKSLVDIEGRFWAITPKGRAVLAKIVKMFDNALKFEIFSGVRVTRALDENERQDGDPNLVLDYLYDPRFVHPGEDCSEAEDLRIAMLTFLTEQEGTSTLDPRRIVFVQKLIDKEFRGEHFFFDLLVGKFFNEVDEIARSAYQWRDIGSTEEEAVQIMRTLYTAGMLEQRKRDGKECSECGIPLAVFDLLATEQGEELLDCPNPDCQADFRVKTVTVMEDVEVPAEYATVTEYVDEPVWVSYDSYGYVPCGYYDPWSPLDEALFLCFCVALW